MPSRLKLLLAIHNHQPVGNLEHVFEMAFERCYAPLLDALARHPGVELSVHHTGPLLEWLRLERPEYIQKLRALAERGQVEILGGGFYEPMLPVLPESDAIGQIQMMADFCEEHLGQRPRGLWLAERVWEPNLARLLHRAEIAYTLVDDTHLKLGGVSGALAHGHYITEKAGHPLRLFPIHRELREAIPFSPVDDILALLERTLEESGQEELTLCWGDDGEKLGLWPNTWEWVHESGWLEDFLSALESTPWLETGTLSGHVDTHAPTARIYLPTSSYDEMAAWTLPHESIAPYLAFRERLEKSGELAELGPFVRGGVWQSFLSKYPESNAIHKKAVRVSRKLHALEERLEGAHSPHMQELEGELERARVDLYRGQCNCALWHGLFGGIYLNWLRGALHEHLIAAERRLDRALHGQRFLVHRVEDLDIDGHDEVFVASDELALTLAPRHGGAIAEIDLRDFDFCPTDVLTRRVESYHQDIQSAPSRQPDLERVVVHDALPRFNFADGIFARVDPDDFLDALMRGVQSPLIDIADTPLGPPHINSPSDGALEIRFEADLRGPPALRLGKRLRVGAEGASFEVDYAISSPEPIGEGRWLCVTFNLTLHTPDPPDHCLEIGYDGHMTEPIPLNIAGHGRGERIRLIDAWRGLRIDIDVDVTTLLFHYPIETVSKSEAGLERIYQGTSFVLAFDLPHDGSAYARHFRFSATRLDESET